MVEQLSSPERNNLEFAKASVAVVIPTYGRGTRVLRTLDRIMRCDPQPREIWIHLDNPDSQLEMELAVKFPAVKMIRSRARVGPGGGRHLCLRNCTTDWAVCFDDDSYPNDADFFARVVALFSKTPEAAVIGATIWQRHQVEPKLNSTFVRKLSFTGCGHAIRLSAYRDIWGYVPRGIAYGLEETDVALQLYAKNYAIYESGQLRVFHDTELRHHREPEITECVVANAALFAFLRYPIWLWGLGLFQLSSIIAYCLSVGRWRGVFSGVLRVPRDCIALRRFRRTLPAVQVIGYLKARRNLK
jgi:glycosyltransferase involved in cell wall biosynthesis